MVGSLNNYDEETLVKMILAGLDRVLKSRKIDKDYLNEVKVHKIVYMVAEDLNLDITRSWYMRGCYVWCNKPINEYFKPYGRIYLDPSPDIIDAINNVIRVLEVFSLKRQDFLKKLYEEFAPSEFRNLYIAY